MQISLFSSTMNHRNYRYVRKWIQKSIEHITGTEVNYYLIVNFELRANCSMKFESNLSKSIWKFSALLLMNMRSSIPGVVGHLKLSNSLWIWRDCHPVCVCVCVFVYSFVCFYLSSFLACIKLICVSSSKRQHLLAQKRNHWTSSHLNWKSSLSLKRLCKVSDITTGIKSIITSSTAQCRKI